MSDFMRTARFFALLPTLVLSSPIACSGDPEGGPAAPGSVALEALVSEHAATVLRFTATVKNTTGKAMSTLDSMDVDTGPGPKRATLLQACDAGDAAPWLVKAGGSQSLSFTIRNNGPDRMVVDGKCASGKSALWEFQTFTKIETNGSAPLDLSMTGTLEGGASWTAAAKSTR